VLLLGCSQGVQKQQPVQEEPAKPQVQAAEPAPAEPMSPSPQLPAATRPSTEEAVRPVADTEVPIRLCTLLQDGESGKAGLVDRRTGKQAMVRVGHVFSGYELVKIDAQTEQVVLKKDGLEYTLGVSENAISDHPVAPAAPAIPAPQAQITDAPVPVERPDQLFPSTADISKMPPQEKFVPTPEEISAGIDPNNAATWPKTYRGPGIERAIKAQHDAETGR
jgi:hypothetical protein